jgi:hypothetical protein
MTIVSSNLGNFEMFELVPVGKGTWVLSAESNRKFVTVHPERKKPLVNDSADADAAQTFDISVQAGLSTEWPCGRRPSPR